MGPCRGLNWHLWSISIVKHHFIYVGLFHFSFSENILFTFLTHFFFLGYLCSLSLKMEGFLFVCLRCELKNRPVVIISLLVETKCLTVPVCCKWHPWHHVMQGTHAMPVTWHHVAGVTKKRQRVTSALKTCIHSESSKRNTEPLCVSLPLYIHV